MKDYLPILLEMERKQRMRDKAFVALIVTAVVFIVALIITH